MCKHHVVGNCCIAAFIPPNGDKSKFVPVLLPGVILALEARTQNRVAPSATGFTLGPPVKPEDDSEVRSENDGKEGQRMTKALAGKSRAG